MTRTVNLFVSKDLLKYYADCDLSQVCNFLLDKYDITSLPQIESDTMTDKLHRRVKITNSLYDLLIDTYGPRSNKCSLARLLEFGRQIDILSVCPSLCDTTQSRTPTTDELLRLFLKDINKEHLFEQFKEVLNERDTDKTGSV